MENFVFENSTKTYFGKKCVSQYLPDLLSQYGSRVVLAYGGGSIKRTGIYDEIMGILKDAGKDVVEFSGIMANPTYDKVLEGAAARSERDHPRRRPPLARRGTGTDVPAYCCYGTRSGRLDGVVHPSR